MQKTPREIRWTIAASYVGQVLVAVSDGGVCAVLIGDDDEALLQELQRRYPHASVRQDGSWGSIAADVLRLIERPTDPIPVSVDLRGTEFQRAVWNCLRQALGVLPGEWGMT